MSGSGSIKLDFDAPTNSSYNDYFEYGISDENGTILYASRTGNDSSLTAAAVKLESLPVLEAYKIVPFSSEIPYSK